MFRSVLDASRRRKIVENSAWEASRKRLEDTHTRSFPGCTRTLWDIPRGLQNALGRVGTFLEAFKTLWEGPNIMPVV